MLIGTNADPTHNFKPADIVRSGVWLVRYPLNLGFNYGPYRAGLLDAQIRPVPVIHGNSFTAAERRNKTYLSRLRWWAKGIPDPQYIQVGNEPDQPNSGSSWHLARADYYRLLRNARTAWPNTTIVAGGLVHVDFSYLDNVPADIAAIHPYTQTADSVGALIAECRNHTDLPLWCTEVGVPKSFYPTIHERAQWHTDMLVALWQDGVEAAIQFPYSPLMNAEFDGMIDGEGNPTEVWAAVSSAIDPLQGDPASAGGLAPQLEFVPGLVQGTLTSPFGVILHATRSGAVHSPAAEYDGTVNYVRHGTDGTVGWNATIEGNRICEHMRPDQWGWNAREHSSHFVAVEVAQSRLHEPISDETFDTLAWYIKEKVFARWPTIPRFFPHHSELAAGIRDGKTDMAPRGTAEAEDLRNRLLSRL